MRHATWNSVLVLLTGKNAGLRLDSGVEWWPRKRACDWADVDQRLEPGTDFFGDVEAATLRLGETTKLPNCPTCASFIDAALTIRAEAEQEKINAELDAEREAR